MVAAEVKKSATNAEQLLAAFQTAAEKMGVFEERIAEHRLTSEVPEIFVEYARLRDLTIVPVPEGDTSINGTLNRSSSAPAVQPSSCRTPASEPRPSRSIP